MPPVKSGWLDNLTPGTQTMRLRAVGDWLGRRTAPWMLAVGLLLAIAILVAPWGDYPLNDDWQYARAAQLFAETGHVVIDTPIAPSLVGQVVIAWPLIKVFGPSHRVLRLLTLAMAALVLWSLDRILVYGRVSRANRSKGLVLLVLHPWFLNLAFSFMTECYGYALALLGTVVWLGSRRACDRAYARPVVTLSGSVIAALLVGASFWVRQFCVLTYAAMVGAALFHIASTRTWRRLGDSLVRIAVGALVLAGTVVAYFPWAKDHRLLKDSFSGPLGQLVHFNLVDYQVVLGLQLIYLGVALAPMFVSWPWRNGARTILACAVTLGFGLGVHSLFQLVASGDAGAVNLHRHFPYASNIINTDGVGPNTLTDVFFGNSVAYAVLSRTFWQIVGCAVLASTALWGLPLASLGRLRKIAGAGRETFVFGLAFALFSLAMVTQTSGQNGFDRYYWPVLVGIAVCAIILLDGEEQALRPPRKRALATAAFIIVALPLAVFSVGGVHDYFRWNDARWRLVEHARQLGVPTTSIDGGYEVNGALSFDLVRNHPKAIDQSHCIGRCHCEIPWDLGPIWTCYDDSYRVGMTVRNGYLELARDQPNTWLGNDRPLVLSRRPGK